MGLFKKLRAIAPIIKIFAPKIPVDAVLEVKDAVTKATKKRKG